MEDHGTAELPAEVLLTELEQGLAGSVAQQSQQGLLVPQDEGVEGGWEGEDRVKGRDREQCRLAVLQSLAGGEGLTRGAVAMMEGVLGVALARTLRTSCGVPAELGGTADRDIVHDLLMLRWNGMGGAGGFPREAADIGHCPLWWV